MEIYIDTCSFLFILEHYEFSFFDYSNISLTRLATSRTCNFSLYKFFKILGTTAPSD
jgi:hypothetical protein